MEPSQRTDLGKGLRSQWKTDKDIQMAVSGLVVPIAELPQFARVRIVRSPYAGTPGFIFPGEGKSWKVYSIFATGSVAGNWNLYITCNLMSESNPLWVFSQVGGVIGYTWQNGLWITYGQALAITVDSGGSVLTRAYVQEYDYEIPRNDTTA